MEWLLASAAGFFAAVLGALGMGGGGVLLVYLTVVSGMPQLQAQGVNLLFFVPVASVALMIHTRGKRVAWRFALAGISAGAVGVFVGFYLAQRIGDRWLSKLFGVFLLLLGARELLAGQTLRRNKKRRKKTAGKPPPR